MPPFTKETHVASVKPLPGLWAALPSAEGRRGFLRRPRPACCSPCMSPEHIQRAPSLPIVLLLEGPPPTDCKEAHTPRDSSDAASHTVSPASPPCRLCPLRTQSCPSPLVSLLAARLPKALFRPPRQRGPAPLGEGVGSREPGLTLSRTHSSKRSLSNRHSFTFLKVFVLRLKSGLLCL